MPESRVGGEELPVKGRLLPFSHRHLLGEEIHGSPGAIQEVLQDGTHVGIRSINSQRDLSTRTRLHKLRDRG